MHHRPRGFVLLYIILVITFILTSLSLSAGMTGVFAGNRLRLDQEAAQVRLQAEDCGELLLMQLRTATTTSGTGALPVNAGSCTYSIPGGTLPKAITLTASDGLLYKRLTITITQLDPTITASWVEGS
jgi:hypothetical protein